MIRTLSIMTLILFQHVLSPFSSYAQSTLEPKPPTSSKTENTKKNHSIDPLNWAVSFGTTQLFENWFGQSKLNLPVSSATLMLARNIHQKVKTWLIFNLPLVPSQKIDDLGQASFDPNPPVILVGASVVLMSIELKRDKKLEGELGVYGGQVLENNGLYFPLAAGRLSLVKKEDLAIYLGLSASIRVDTLGLIYGVEHRF